MNLLTPHSVTESVFAGLSNELEAAIATDNEGWARIVLKVALDATITKTMYEELRQDFETAFGEL